MKNAECEVSAGGNVLARFENRHEPPSLNKLVGTLLDDQKSSWPDLQQGYENLHAVRTRRLFCGSFSLYLQFNPARIASTAAPSDPAAIKRRRCFLCVRNRPREQKAVIYRRRYAILCNPYPIFPGHLTIAHLHHEPQAIETEFAYLFMLAEDLGPDYLVFYNGPLCGASAPDHMHFQASPQGVMPIEEDLQSTSRQYMQRRVNDVDLTRFVDLGREVLMLEGRNPTSMEGVMKRLFDLMRQMSRKPSEPMVNLYCTYSGSSWRLVAFLRGKHRPDAYFLKDKGRIMISPGLVDMGGLIVTPREEDFYTLDAESAQDILREVSLEGNLASDLFSRL
jgi:hypothetical protein